MKRDEDSPTSTTADTELAPPPKPGALLAVTIGAIGAVALAAAAVGLGGSSQPPPSAVASTRPTEQLIALEDGVPHTRLSQASTTASAVVAVFADRPLIALSVGQRSVAIDAPTRQLDLRLTAEERARELVVLATSVDRQHATSLLAVGATRLWLSFPATGAAGPR